MTFNEPDLLTAINVHVPCDGPHSEDTVRDAAAGVAALVRYLNHATGPWNQQAALPYAPIVDSILGRIAGAVYGLDQLFGQLAAALHHHAADPTLYDDRRDRPGAQTAQQAALALEDAQSFEDAQAAVRALAAVIDEARALTGHLGHDLGGQS